MIPVLEVRDAKVIYGAVTALHELSMVVEEGELLTVVGANGAGKSSLVKAICGLTPLAKGTIKLLGEDLRGEAPETISGRGVALVPEGRRVFGTLTVAENLKLASLPYRRRRGGSIAEDTERVLARFPAVRDALKRHADSLSGGQAQQLAIARALLQRPKLLILDEPSLGLAPVIVEEIFALLDELRGEGMTILLIEQNVVHAVRLADRSIVLNTGRVVMSVDRADMPQADALAEAIFGVA
jgi:branched-chain amino acid transport system ATP-binding protein